MAEQFTVPGGVIDFDCPDGLLWDVKESDVPDDVRPTEKKPCGCGKQRKHADSATGQVPTPTRLSCLECVEKVRPKKPP